MSGTKAVHQCLFCPQTFSSAVEKDDHTLEHFAQETCADCDQSLIRIGSKLYTEHNAVTCIKRELKSDIRIQYDGLINQNRVEGEYNAMLTSSQIVSDERMRIKVEPEAQDDPMSCVNVASMVETCYIEDHQATNNQNSAENISAINVEPSNTVSVQQVEIKMEPGVQVEQFIPVDVNDLNNSTESNPTDFDTCQVLQSQSHHSTPLEKMSAAKRKTNYKHKCDICGRMFQGPAKLEQHQKYTHSALGTVFSRFECEICKTDVKTEGSLRRHMKMKHGNCIKYNCDFCWAVFLKKQSLVNHLPHCKRPKKSIYVTKKQQTSTQGAVCVDGSRKEQTQDEQSKIVDITETSHVELHSSQLTKFRPEEKSPESSRKRNYKDDRVPCDICGEIFLPFFLERHKKYKHRPVDECAKQDRFECEICERVLNNKKALQQHKRLKHNATIFKCDFCSVVLMSQKSLDNHHLFRCKRIKKSANETPGNDFITVESAQKIEKSENCDEKDRYCEICDKIFTRRNCAERHKFRVHKIGGHHCINCRQVFHTKIGLINHGPKCIHSLNATFECYICHNIYHSKRYLRFHIRSTHLPYEKKFKCEICERSFHLLAKYEYHMNRIHLNLDIRNFMCSTCGKKFNSKQNLSQHERIHTRERPFQCPIDGCARTFRTHSAKYIHLRLHRGEKHFQCRINGCNEQFGGRIGFKKHKLNVHGIA